MRIELEESDVAVTGTFKAFGSTDQVVSRLIAAGALSAARHRTPQTSVVVWGRSHGGTRVPSGGERNVPKMVKHGRLRGLPILNEDQLVELLSTGSLTLEEEGLNGAGEERLSGLLGQARSLLDGVPSSETWSAIVRLVGECDVGERDALVDYLAPQLSRWRAMEAYARWHVPADDALRVGLPDAFFSQLPLGTVRVAYPRWIYDAIEGRGAGRLRLAEFVSLAGLDPSVTDVFTLLGLDELSGMRGLDLTSVSVGSIPWGKVAERAAWRNLESLTFGQVDVTERTLLEESGLFHGVRRVWVRSSYPYDLDGIGRTLASEMFEDVEVVVVEGTHAFEGLARALRDPKALPSLRECVVYSGRAFVGVPDDVDAVRVVVQSVERLRLVCAELNGWAVKHVCSLVFDGLRVLDLSGLGYLDQTRKHELMQARRALAANLPNSVLAGSLERVALGKLATAPLVERLWEAELGVEGW